MKRILLLLALVAGALAFAAVGAADPGHGHKGKNKDKHGKGKFTFVLTTTDNGSCGTPWAQDFEQRQFTVKDNGDGTFRLTRRDRGFFKTTGVVSPGACEKTKPHGTTLQPGVTGKFHGFLVGTISGGAFNPNATCTGDDCGTTTKFIATYFGAGAQFSCFANSADCKFGFEYSAPHQSLALHHWQDRGTGAGTMLNEQFKGDISLDRLS